MLRPASTELIGVGTAAGDRLERGVLERVGIDRVLRQHRHQPEDQRQLAVVGAGQIEPHLASGERLGLGDLGVVGAEVRPALVAQQLPGKDHVLGRDRLAVGKLRRGIDLERDIGALGVGLDGPRQQAIERERLVIAARHQAFDHVAAHLRQREALHDERIDAVEGAEDAVREPPALGRLWIGIADAVEARGLGRLAVHGDGVLRRAGPRLCISRRQQRERGKSERTKPDRCEARDRPLRQGRVGSHGSRVVPMESPILRRSSTASDQ